METPSGLQFRILPAFRMRYAYLCTSLQTASLTDNRKNILLLLAIGIIALNLRPSITAIGPLIGEIRSDTGLSNTLLGFLTTLPVLAFGLFSVLTPVFTRRFGTEGTMLIALLMLAAGILIRTAQPLIFLFAGTALLGVGIALGNVLLPGIVKKSFPGRYGAVTGLYSSMLGVGATAGAAFSVPLSQGTGLGWRFSIGFWVAGVVLAIAAWLPQMKFNLPVQARRGLRDSLRNLSSSKTAWGVAFFMGLQSLSFFTIIAWLPEILTGRNATAEYAGYMLALTQGTGVIGTLIVPQWAARLQRQRLPVYLLVTAEIVSIGGLLIPSLYLTGLWVALLGFSLGGTFGLALLFIVLRTRDSGSANELSAVSQSVGYTLAAAGPTFFGALFDLSGSWTIPMFLLLIIAAGKAAAGRIAGSDSYV
ncbi:CynX/NimT family MFS transporter [Rhodohalobacter mucosus]|uniref:MFS transporter n=1 Tax=Rhodohalobacter mucosus TaxID=2079485 RepID=A0A316TWF4_9BACT|nr:MFS transporter [Rhodohalobacter mucosus]PWN07719.1 MFS transporter [Rhodohalobacter mucosus]